MRGAGGGAGLRCSSFPPPLPFCGSDLEASSERCRWFLCLRLIYFIAGVPELLCWLQHIIRISLPSNSLSLATHWSMILAPLCDVAGAQLVEAQDTPWLPCQLLSQGARAPARGAEPAILPQGRILFILPISLVVSSLERRERAETAMFLFVSVFSSFLVWLHPSRNTYHLPRAQEKVTAF